jgi:hypothetical protein
MEPTTGIEPVNLFLTKEALYLLSYVGLINMVNKWSTTITKNVMQRLLSCNSP